MRISYSEDEDYPGQFGLWQANCDRSIAGRAGQLALRELEAALLALPEKRLIAHELERDGDVCAIGALVKYKGITPKNDPDGEMDLIGVECGIPRLAAWKLVELNDSILDTKWSDGKLIPLTPEERYQSVLDWVRKRLKSVA